MSVPPIAPPIPKGFQNDSGDTSSIRSTTSDPLDPTAYFIPNSDDFSVIIDPPSAESSESGSVLGEITPTSFAFKGFGAFKELKLTSPLDESPPYKLSEFKPTHIRDIVQPLERIRTTSIIRDRTSSFNSDRTRTSSSVSTPSPRRERPAAQLALQDATQLGGEAAKSLFRIDRMQEMGEGALFMHLYQASRMVYGAKEAMWEELVVRINKKDQSLEMYGWNSEHDFRIEESRRKFEGLFDGYKQYVRRYAN